MRYFMIVKSDDDFDATLEYIFIYLLKFIS